MAILNIEYAEEFEYNERVVSEDDAYEYAKQVAEEALQAYIAQQETREVKENETMNLDLQATADAVATETKTNVSLISGEILLDNIETLADKLVLSKLSWWQRMTITKQNKELAVTLATYAIVHAIKTGGFGLTKYRIDHAALDYVTLAANNRLLKYVVKSTGVDTNVASMLLKTPTVTVGA